MIPQNGINSWDLPTDFPNPVRAKMFCTVPRVILLLIAIAFLCYYEVLFLGLVSPFLPIPSHKTTLTFLGGIGGHAFCTDLMLLGRRGGNTGSFYLNLDRFGTKDVTKDVLKFLGVQQSSLLSKAPLDTSSKLVLEFFGWNSKLVKGWSVTFMPNQMRKPFVVSGLSWLFVDDFSPSHYFHLMEGILGLWSVSQEYCPLCAVENVAFMVDKKKIQNHHFVEELFTAIFGRTPKIYFLSDFLDIFRSGRDLLFEKVSTSDRWRCNSEMTRSLKKMNAGHYQLIRKHIHSLRHLVFNSLNISTISKNQGDAPIKLIVIDRHESVEEGSIKNTNRLHRNLRDFAPKIKNDLLKRLGEIYDQTSTTNVTSFFPNKNGSNSTTRPLFQVSVVRFQDYSIADQIKIAARHDAMVGMHGNGLTNLLWLGAERKDREFVCEIFPTDYVYDYQLFGYFSGVRHFAFSAQDGIIKGMENIPESALNSSCHLTSGNPNGNVHHLNVELLVAHIVAAATLPRAASFPPWKTC